MDDYEAIERKIKKFVNEMIEEAVAAKTKNTVKSCFEMAYGAIFFAANNLFPCYNVDLACWWKNEAHPIFYRILTNKEEA